MNVALQRALSAVDLNFNPPAFPLAQLRIAPASAGA